MLCLIGLGLNENSISLEGKEALDKCSLVYLESYTVDFPYTIESLQKSLGKKIEKLGRDKVESSKLVIEAKTQEVALLVYGCPLFATTHTTLLLDCKKQKIKTRVIYNASVFDAIAETGLQLYKFGKITSMPKWQKSFTPDSFLDIVKENNSIKAHSLILTDIGLKLEDALSQLELACKNKNIKLDKIIISSSLGTDKAKIYYDKPENLKTKKVSMPFCIIIPSELHFLEKEYLEKI